jgi:Tfp pilus assembly protein PilO
VTARLASLPTKAQVALVAGALFLIALIGYFALISPKHSAAASLKKQTAVVQAQITANRSTAFTQALPAVRSASIFRLTQAMPSQLDTPDVILQLNGLAEDSGLSFDQIQPGSSGSETTSATPDTTDPFAVEPIQVEFSGSFYNLLAFLQRLRNLVRVENGNLYTAGRLFDVSSVTFAAGPKGFPQVQATLVVNEFVPQTPTSAPTATPGSTDTTSTTTTDTTTTTSTPTAASPSTSGGTS